MSCFSPRRFTAAYTAEQLTVLPEGSVRVVRGLNDDDEAVGGATVRDKHHALRLKRNSLEQVEGSSGSDHSAAHGINDLGEIVGAANSAKAVHVFRAARNAKGVDLGTLPGDSGSAAFAVNRQGQAVGYSSGAAGVRAVLWSKAGAIQALPRLAASKSSKALAINEGGEAVGMSVIASNPRATLWRGNSAQDLGTLPGHKESEALAIPLGFALLTLQGISEVVKKAALLQQATPAETRKN